MLTWKDLINFSVKGNPIPNFKIKKTDAHWRLNLTPEQFRITRQKGTERPNSGSFCSSYEDGKYNCVCCQAPLFYSAI